MSIIGIEIDCRGYNCGDCKYLAAGGQPYCILYRDYLSNDDQYQPIRIEECIEAEIGKKIE